MSPRQWTVDAFAEGPFLGNPACVLEPMADWPSDGWMQALAMENNQAETAFLRPTDDPARFELRWFTPGREVDLCGHATLAAAHVLWSELGATAQTLRFSTRSGALSVRHDGDGYVMDLPADPPRRVETPQGLESILGRTVVETWAARYLVAVLENAEAVRACAPDIRAMRGFDSEAGEAGEVVVCAPADMDGVDVVDRFFAPGCGVDEDPATGSAHCILGPMWADRLGRPDVAFHQAYPGRGGAIRTRTRGDRVMLTGRAVTTIESRLRLSPR